METRRLRTSLYLVQLVGIATLLRSVAWDRWITVLASILLIAGATSALRGRAWGVALAFASACAFPIAFAIGIAPAWFPIVGVVGALPFLLTRRAFARFDRAATWLLATLAAVGGAAGAFAWKLWAADLFYAFPSLTPTHYAPQHGVALLSIAVIGAVVAGWSRRTTTLADAPRVRVAADGHARIDTSVANELVARPRAEAEDESEECYGAQHDEAEAHLLRRSHQPR